MSKFPHGVLTGKQVQDVFNDAKVNQYALPAVNVTNTSTVNAVLEAAAEVNSPVIIQFSARNRTKILIFQQFNFIKQNVSSFSILFNS